MEWLIPAAAIHHDNVM